MLGQWRVSSHPLLTENHYVETVATRFSLKIIMSKPEECYQPPWRGQESFLTASSNHALALFSSLFVGAVPVKFWTLSAEGSIDISANLSDAIYIARILMDSNEFKYVWSLFHHCFMVHCVHSGCKPLKSMSLHRTKKKTPLASPPRTLVEDRLSPGWMRTIFSQRRPSLGCG